MAVRESADVVVVGAGHNGLIAAAYLAAAGLEVVVLEAREIIGGNTVTEELTRPGFRHDSCSSAHVLIQSNPLIRDDELDLRRHGLTYVHTDPAMVMQLGDGSSLVMHRDVDATAEQIARWSAVDAQAYRQMLADWRAGLARAHARWNAGILDATAGEEDKRYAELRDRTAWDVVHDLFTDQRVRDFIMWLSFATIRRPQQPGTGVLPYAITAGRTQYGWATPLGGSGALPAALVRLIEHRGGTVRTGQPVERIHLRDGRAHAVTSAGGETVTARRAIVSSAHVTALPRMLAGDTPQHLLETQQRWRPGLTLFAVHLAVRGTPHYPLPVGEPIQAVAGGLGSAAGLRDQIAAFDRGATHDTDPWLLVVCPNSVDPSRAPTGHSTVKLLTIAPRTLSGGDWRSERARFASALVAHAARRIDGLSESAVLDVVGECPEDLERRNPANVGGSCHGGEFVEDDGSVAVGVADPRLLPGLYLTGSTAHPGGSVSGRPGRNVARRVLSDLGIDPSLVMGAD